jgi:hypothetical protein
MKHFTTLLTALLLAFTLQLWGQTTYLRGVLMDQETKNPIAYARIAPLGQPKAGGLSNVDGGFRISWSQDFDSVLIRHLNYGQVKIEVAALRDTVWLTPVPIELDEVPIFSESPEDLWKRVIEHVDENHFHEEVAYEADARCMIYSHDRDTLHYISQSRANLYISQSRANLYLHKKESPLADHVRISRKPISERGEELAESEHIPLFEIPYLHFMETDAPFFRNSAIRKYDIEVERSFTREGRYLAEVHLIPKWFTKKARGVFLIDLETYGMVWARMEWLWGIGRKRDLAWYEWAYEQIGGKYYQTYADHGLGCLPDEPYIQQTITHLTVVDQAPSEEAVNYFYLVFHIPAKKFQIPWDDPYWQSRPSVPWPDWVAKRLEAEGLAR